jgi:hypothetical protein
MNAQIDYSCDVFISHSLADRGWVENTLLPALTAAGLKVMIGSRDFSIGVPNLMNIERAVDQSRYVVLVLTPDWVGSEWAEFGGVLAQTRGLAGRLWCVLPLLLKPCELPSRIAALNYADFTDRTVWESEMERLVRQVRSQAPGPPSPQEQAIRSPKPYADTAFINSLREPGGTEPPDSTFYIEREGDILFARELRKPLGTTTIIRAPRQTGKSSLLVRGLANAIKQDSKIVFMDMQSVGTDDLRSSDTFLHYFAIKIANRLELNSAEVEQVWNSPRSPQDKLTFFIEEHVFRKYTKKIVLAIDEADRLLGFEFCDSFFALMRSWHENRARSILFSDYWINLSISLVISTDPNLMISNINQSPFNVGTEIYLDDLDEDQVRDLNFRYRSPVEDNEMPYFMNLLDGHPYLTRKALYTMINRRITWDKLTKIATSSNSPFYNHLRHYMSRLQDKNDLKNEFKYIIKHGKCSDELHFNRLLQAGLVKGETGQCRCRCALYSEYLKDRIQ